MPKPPVAAQRPHSFTHHGITVEDPYAWLHDQSYPEVDDKDVLAYLEAENDYFEAVMTPHKATIDALFEEIKARQKPDDATVPVKDGAYYYQSRFAEGQQYRVYTRWTGTADPAEASDVETILDVPALAEGKDFFRLGTFSVSHDHRYLAYSTDTDGSERYTLVVKDLETGELLAERIENTRGPVVWASDNKTILYLISNEQWRPYQVRRHTLGSDVGTDPIVFEEADEGFFVGLGQTMSRKYITINTGDHVTSEVRLLASADPSAELRLVAPRRTGHEYDIEHQEERLIIRTNDQHKNFRVVTVPVDAPDEENWKTLIAGSDTHYITGMECFRDWIVLEERVEGLDRIRIMDSAGQSHFVEFPDQTYVAHINANEQYETSEVRLSYTSLVTPYTIFDYTIEPRTLTTRKVQEIPSGYDAAAYTTQRRMAKARDGVEVPVSIVYRKDTPLDGTAPLYLYGYGAYGSAMSPSFGTSRLSLLDRGFVYAIAHIRGGDELGYQWYEDGKLDKRTNTFNDFVDVARFLIDREIHAVRSHRNCRRQRRRGADGRGRQSGARALGCGGSARAFCRRPQHHARRQLAPHTPGVARMG